MSAQLWVSDVFKVFKSQEDIEKKLVKFKNISVLGTIVNVEMSPNLYEGSNDKRPVVYQVDDGTGVIRVVYFIHDKWPDREERSTWTNAKVLYGMVLPISASSTDL